MENFLLLYYSFFIFHNCDHVECTFYISEYASFTIHALHGQNIKTAGSSKVITTIIHLIDCSILSGSILLYFPQLFTITFSIQCFVAGPPSITPIVFPLGYNTCSTAITLGMPISAWPGCPQPIPWCSHLLMLIFCQCGARCVQAEAWA